MRVPTAPLHAALLALLAIVVYAGFEYDVEFDTKKPLGLKLDTTLKVLGFSRDGAGRRLAAESSARIKAGDRLVAVNEQQVERLSPNDVAYLIAKADLPKVLTFHTDDDSRINEAEEIEKELALLEASSGSLQLYLNGVKYKEYPAVMAAFGNKPQCRFLELAYAKPRDACSVITNPRQIKGKIVIVERGLCPFSDKAANVEEAGGHAFLLLNDGGPAIRMPKNTDNPVYNNIPAFMMGDEASEQFKLVVSRKMTLLQGLLKLDMVDCNLKPKTEEEEGSNATTTSLEAFDAGVFRVQFGSSAPDIGPAGELLKSAMGSGSSDGFGFNAEVEASSPAPTTVTLSLAGEAEFLQAEFGRQWGTAPHRLLLAQPTDGCSLKPQAMGPTEDAVLLVERGGCSFEEKAKAAAAVGAYGVIVANTEPGCFRLKQASRPSHEPISELEALEKAQIESQHSEAPHMARPEEVEPVVVREGPAVASVSKGGGQELRKLLEKFQASRRSNEEAWVWAVPRNAVAALWEEVQDMLEPTAWPKRYRDRRKLYFRMSKIHHPDKEEGSDERFQTLNYAYRRANNHYDPKAEPLDDFN